MNKPVSLTDLSDAALGGPRIALFVEDGSGDWHARRLKKAMQARGVRLMQAGDVLPELLDNASRPLDTRLESE